MGHRRETWRRGGSAKRIDELLERITHDLAPAAAARSSDGSCARVRELVARGRPFLHELASMMPHTAIDLLLGEVGFCDKDHNERRRWARLLSVRLGQDAAMLTLWLLADVVADGTAVSVGGCLSWRLPRIAAGKPRAVSYTHLTLPTNYSV